MVKKAFSDKMSFEQKTEKHPFLQIVFQVEEKCIQRVRGRDMLSGQSNNKEWNNDRR